MDVRKFEVYPPRLTLIPESFGVSGGLRPVKVRMMVTSDRDDVPGFNEVAAFCEEDIKSIFPMGRFVNYLT